MIPRSNHKDFNLQFQVNQDKELAQIFHKSLQEENMKSLSLKPGFEYTLKISVTGQISTQEFQDLSLNHRKCRLSHEIFEGSIFKIYSQSNCQYECHVLKAYESCSCIPWDFLHYINEAPECDVFGRTCFFRSLENNKHDPFDHCSHCIEECDQVSFAASISDMKSLTLKLTNYGGYCNHLICTELLGYIERYSHK